MTGIVLIYWSNMLSAADCIDEDTSKPQLSNNSVGEEDAQVFCL